MDVFNFVERGLSHAAGYRGGMTVYLVLFGDYFLVRKGWRMICQRLFFPFEQASDCLIPLFPLPRLLNITFTSMICG